MGRFMTEPTTVLPPKPPSNGLGIAGFVVSLAGFIACPFVAPIGLLLSFIAVFREPRGFAIAGLVLGLLSSIGMLVLLIVLGAVLAVAVAAMAAHGLPGLDAAFEMIKIGDQARVHRRLNGAYPVSMDAMGAALAPDERTDWWGRPYAYTLSADGTEFSLRSLGPDGQAETNDDIVLDQSWLSEP